MYLNKSTDFENLEFDPFNSGNFLEQNDQSDPDVNLLDGINLIKTNFFDIDGLTEQLESSRQNSFSIFYLNIRSLNKKSVTLKNLLVKLSFVFKIICLTATRF